MSAYEAWGVERGQPVLLGTGATKGDCDRIHRRSSSGGITVSGGVVVAVKTGTSTKAKASLQHAALAAFRERGNLPAPEERASVAGPRPAPEPYRFADERREDFDERDPEGEPDEDDEGGDDEGGDDERDEARPMASLEGESDEDSDDHDEEEPMRAKATKTETPKAPLALVPSSAPTPSKTEGRCWALGCAEASGNTRADTPEDQRGLCPGHRIKARNLVRHTAEAAQDLRAYLTTTEVPPGTRAPQGKAARAVKRSKTPKAPRSKPVRTKTLRPRAAATVRAVVATPLAERVEAVRRLVELERRAGGVEAVEQLVELAERCGGAGELAALVEAIGGGS